MGRRGVLALVLIALSAVPVWAQHTVTLLDRFLQTDSQPLTSYRVYRHLTATSRGGKMRASLEAWTSLDPQHGFTYEITKSEGSPIIIKHVLMKALEAEQDAVQKANKAQSALTPANYEFLDQSPMEGRLVRIDVRPRRSHVMLING